MTNEALCVQFQNGDGGALWQLWELNQSFTRMMASRVVRACEALGRRDVELEDLVQSAWPALVSAAGAYDPDTGYKFLTLYGKYLKTAFADATGARSKRKWCDPLHWAASIDAPLRENDDESGSMGDFIPSEIDESALVIDHVYADWLKGYLQSQLDTLPEKQARVLRFRYWQGKTFPEIAAEMGLKKHQVKSLEESALNRLSMRWDIIRLREFVGRGRP